eukprot:scaffold1403_cov180-Ochromonas_danica.AAC.31
MAAWRVARWERRWDFLMVVVEVVLTVLFLLLGLSQGFYCAGLEVHIPLRGIVRPLPSVMQFTSLPILNTNVNRQAVRLPNISHEIDTNRAM